jgi:glutathione S-transferase
MKLFYSPGACSLASHIALREAGFHFELEKVDLKTHEVKGDDYYKVNPKGSVPALQLDKDGILTEGVAIMQWAADQKPSARLVPAAGTMERYRCQEWLNYISTEVHKGFSPLWNPRATDEMKALAKEALVMKFDYLNRSLGDHPFLMGSSYSIADGYLFTVLNWAHPTGVDLAKWPKLVSFVERVKSRPATMEAMKAEGLLH